MTFGYGLAIGGYGKRLYLQVYIYNIYIFIYIHDIQPAESLKNIKHLRGFHDMLVFLN